MGEMHHTVADSIPLSEQISNSKTYDTSTDQQVNLTSNGPSPDREGDNKSSKAPPESEKGNATSQLGWRVHMIFVGLAVSAILSALEGTVISTALPTIAADLGLGGNYVWVINIYFLTR